MKKIPLTKGMFAIVDDEDFDFLNRIDWYASEIKSTYSKSFYPAHKNGDGIILMNKLLVKGKNGYLYHAKNGDTLDCRKENIILVPKHTVSHKSKIRTLQKGKAVTSKYKGVCRASLKSTKGKIRFVASIKKDKKLYHLGTYKTEEEAGLAYNKKAKELYGDIAFQNKI